jgi:hypothetical protein
MWQREDLQFDDIQPTVTAVKVTVGKFKATLCARAVKHFTNMVKRRGLVTTNAELTEYVRECATEDAVANNIPCDEPCRVQDEDIHDILCMALHQQEPIVNRGC